MTYIRVIWVLFCRVVLVGKAMPESEIHATGKAPIIGVAMAWLVIINASE